MNIYFIQKLIKLFFISRPIILLKMRLNGSVKIRPQATSYIIFPMMWKMEHLLEFYQDQ